MNLTGKTIALVIDDEPLVGHAVKRMLQIDRDIQVHFCQHTLDAIAMANRLHPTVILQDLVMPNDDGLKMVEAFRANPQTHNTPVLVLSGKEEPFIKLAAFERGASDYLVKFPDRVELVARVKHHSRTYLESFERQRSYETLIASEKVIAGELAQASRYVYSLLPAPLTTGPVRVDWRFVPSTQLAGDAFGYRWLDDETFAMYLLDVSGHGVGSSLLAVSVLHILTNGNLPAVDFRDPAAVLRGLNAIFKMESQGGMFFTLWYGVFNTRRRRLRFGSGGHPSPILIRGSDSVGGHIRELTAYGPPIGLTTLIPFENEEVEVEQGSRLLIYSDGAVEIEKPEGGIASHSEFREFIASIGRDDQLLERVLRRTADVGGSFLRDDCSLVQADFTLGA